MSPEPPILDRRPRVTWDDEGSLVTYPGLSCTAPGCGIQLTSRNRYGKRDQCIEHGRETRRQYTQQRAERRRQEAAAKADAERTAQAATSAQLLAPPQDPKAHVIQLLGRWLAHPELPELLADVQASMRDYELKHRLMRALPTTTIENPR